MGAAGQGVEWRGLDLGSAFQPIFSLSHGRLVGWEALLRAVRRSDGAACPPADLFAGLATRDDRAQLDLHGLRAHLRRRAAQAADASAQWLFLNLDPASLDAEGGVQRVVAEVLAAGLPPERLVIEVLESPFGLSDGLRQGVEALRALGCLIAIDDFGAGHSNFERVFELRPHIVKLDRHVLLRAKQGPRPMRIVAQMVALLHECGALVLMEGIETVEGAHIALGCDVDLVQGYFFGRPQPLPQPEPQQLERLQQAWRTFDTGLTDVPRQARGLLQPEIDALEQASRWLVQGLPLDEACRGFLSLPSPSLCYLLDDTGRQVGDATFRPGHSHRSMGQAPQFAPLFDCEGANWSRRRYFRRAMAQPGTVQVTRPYLTLQGGRMCRTLSVAFGLRGRAQVLCGDLEVADG